MWIVLCGTGACLLVAALHPFASYPLSLRILARLRPVPIRAPNAPPGRAALCVCAYNEEKVIRAKIENMISLRGDAPDLEILVYVDAATDRTIDILQDYKNAVRLFVSSERLGKTHGMNLLAAATEADYIVFTDANVMFASGALRPLLRPFADPQVGCVCGHLVYRGSDGATAATGSLYWRMEEHIKSLESKTGSVMGADGSIFAIRRSLHCPPPPDLIDDMYVSLAALCAGARIVRAPDALAYEETVSNADEEFRRKMRIACQAFNVHRALARDLRRLSAIDRYKYLSHKLLRWLTIYFLFGGTLFLLAGIAAAGWHWLAAASAVLQAMCIFAIWQGRSGPLNKIREILAAFVATGIGVWLSLRKQRYQTWEPPTSARIAEKLAA